MAEDAKRRRAARRETGKPVDSGPRRGGVDKPLAALLEDIRKCRICAADMPHRPRPVVRISPTARLCVAGQAPGRRVHESGVPFDDPSGVRLRAWMGIDDATFYDAARVAVIPMGFCFPGYDAAGADKPPRPACVRTWHQRVFETAPRFSLILAIGAHAQAYHLAAGAKRSMTDTVRAWREYAPMVIPLPHPSWRNSAWLKKNPWFERDLLPVLKRRVGEALSGESPS